MILKITVAERIVCWRHDSIAAIEFDYVTITVIPVRGSSVDYEFDTEDQAKAAYLELVAKWQSALAATGP